MPLAFIFNSLATNYSNLFKFKKEALCWGSSRELMLRVTRCRKTLRSLKRISPICSINSGIIFKFNWIGSILRTFYKGAIIKSKLLVMTSMKPSQESTISWGELTIQAQLKTGSKCLLTKVCYILFLILRQNFCIETEVLIKNTQRFDELEEMIKQQKVFNYSLI